MAYEQILLERLNEAVHSLTEEMKTRELSPQELAGSKKVINDLCDLPGVVPEDK
jgi:hypothetical protein